MASLIITCKNLALVYIYYQNLQTSNIFLGLLFKIIKKDLTYLSSRSLHSSKNPQSHSSPSSTIRLPHKGPVLANISKWWNINIQLNFNTSRNYLRNKIFDYLQLKIKLFPLILYCNRKNYDYFYVYQLLLDYT